MKLRLVPSSYCATASFREGPGFSSKPKWAGSMMTEDSTGLPIPPQPSP